MKEKQNAPSTPWKVGNWVEIRSKEEILKTLDAAGQLDGMPFMPEMLAFCGKRFQVYKRAHKTCDTIFPVRGRRVANTVHLDTRCDGSAHGGCQATCMLFWKDAWLKPVDQSRPTDSRPTSSSICDESSANVVCTEEDLWASTTISSQAELPTVYVCQATRLPYATTELEWWDLSQYIEDYTSGNVGLWRAFCGAIYFLYLAISNAGIGLGRPMRWFYDRLYPLWGGAPFPRRQGSILAGQPTPIETLNLQPGELVRVKPYMDILRTLDGESKNRGLFFDAEEVPYCGKTFRVLKRVTKIINERTGEMRYMKVACLILDSVICESRYSECRLFCPRSIYSYWREVWLERVDRNPPIHSNQK